jgi:hypothetical protein
VWFWLRVLTIALLFVTSVVSQGLVWSTLRHTLLQSFQSPSEWLIHVSGTGILSTMLVLSLVT